MEGKVSSPLTGSSVAEATLKSDMIAAIRAVMKIPTCDVTTDEPKNYEPTSAVTALAWIATSAKAVSIRPQMMPGTWLAIRECSMS